MVTDRIVGNRSAAAHAAAPVPPPRSSKVCGAKSGEASPSSRNVTETAAYVAGIRYAAYAAASKGLARIGEVGATPDRYVSIRRLTVRPSASTCADISAELNAVRRSSGISGTDLPILGVTTGRSRNVLLTTPK